jgi:hypothetical protein
MPKDVNSSKKKKVSLDTSKNLLISNMFNKTITECKDTIKCDYCKLLMKSCLLQDHLNTKCKVKLRKNNNKPEYDCDSDIIFLSEVVSPKNENKKLKISNKDSDKLEYKEWELKKENAIIECTPKKIENLITTTTESVFSIFANVEERLRYTPVKNDSVNEVVEQFLNKTIEIKEESLLKVSDEESLIINFVEENENSDKKLNEIQESSISTPKKQNFARKSTSACKYKQHLKENLVDIPTDSISSISSEDLIIQSGDIIDEIENDAIKNSSFCYVLNNFVNAIDSVFENQNFIYLLDENDLQIVNKFHQLTSIKFFESFFSIFV